MGVKHLWDILESCKKTVPLHHLQNKRLCIDLSCWMVQLQKVSKSHSCLKEKVYLRGLFHRIRALIALNCSLIFVTDGSIPAIKLSTYRRRLNLNSGKEVAQNESNLQNISSLRRNMGSEFSCMIKEAKALGSALGILCLNGIEEAEAQCALLNYELLCDGCFSSDSDIFLFGARTVYRDICLGDGGYVVCYEMADIERQLGFGRDSLIALALLLGSDYYQGVYGLGPESACQIVKSSGDKFVLQKMASEGLHFVKKMKGGKKLGKVLKSHNKENILAHNMKVKNGDETHSQRDDDFLQVINAYMKPKCHLADSDTVQRALAHYPFQHGKLQQTCAEFFQWPPEKTDEYILPKIAERDLRRFANLRLTSSELGVQLPLHEIPVKCPVSEIIKRRKVQGREYYEVSWKEMHGLKTSIVPANLLESACPEKISEFEERKALGKKQNIQKRRPKKTETTSSVAELDLKLKNLLLDINLQDCAAHSASGSSGQVLRDTAASSMAEADPISKDLLHDVELVTWNQSNSNISSNEADSGTAESEVIDLLSPSPVKQSHTSSKCQQLSDQRTEVINLSDSEDEMLSDSEHESKAKELRLFLASIRNDIY
ncbi:hypothetical protein L6164_006087 [Bauhinia variegata]|uniref:Uncharacterized protein n=1 Tax=Bauhinia variegata TaxID=167791 RepID=A0ACB9PTV9_BAUVA|nr:hypothetical protein L6164_006087 [Bauhinia variegata]